jgi:hypothetical protein
MLRAETKPRMKPTVGPDKMLSTPLNPEGPIVRGGAGRSYPGGCSQGIAGVPWTSSLIHNRVESNAGQIPTHLEVDPRSGYAANTAA